ncbi:hypothetical protein MUK42_15275 [Musa troglodytarum]|uniref:Uncharacterized protein n=1 Tax=Musa troglodytarum TaxID=320322 RepID=A0A9E7I5P6_9LILI|nr:hypothetical protein MUK42_15275 [Musa troglodytarum]
MFPDANWNTPVPPTMARSAFPDASILPITVSVLSQKLPAVNTSTSGTSDDSSRCDTWKPTPCALPTSADHLEGPVLSTESKMSMSPKV